MSIWTDIAVAVIVIVAGAVAVGAMHQSAIPGTTCPDLPPGWTCSGGVAVAPGSYDPNQYSSGRT